MISDKKDTEQKNNATLVDAPVEQSIIKMALAMLIGIFAMAAFNITDTYFVSKLGTKELAAMSFTFPVAMLIGGLAMGVGIGASALISKSIGMQETLQVRRLTTDSLLLGLAIVIVVSLVGFFTIRPLFTLLGAEEEILPFIEQYMQIWYVGIVFLVIPMIGNNAIRATGDMLTPSLIMIADLGVNIILDPLLIFGLGPFPRLGITGAALATVISRSLALFASLYVLHWQKQMLTFVPPRLMQLLQSWKKILYFGIPTAAIHIFMPLSNGIIMKMVAWSGVEAVAAFGAGQRVETMAVIPILAMGSSIVPFVGQNFGAKKFDRIYKAQRFTGIFAVSWGLACVIVISLLAKPIAGIFSTDAVVLEFLVLFLYIAPFSYGFKGLDLVAGAGMVAIGKPFSATWITMIRLFALMLPLATIGAMTFGFLGLIIGMTTGEVLSGFVSIIWMLVVYKKVFSKIFRRNTAHEIN